MANRYLKDAVSEKIRPLDIEQKQNIMAKAIENPVPEPLSVFAMGLIDPETNEIINVSGSSTEWSAITGTPTTLTGYGITDAQHQSEFLDKVAQTDIQFVFEGDSLTRGPAGAPEDSYPTKAMLLSEFAGHGTSYNLGVGGDGWADVIADYATEVYPKRPQASGDRSILFIWCGTNEIYNSSDTVANMITNFNSYVSTAISDGFEVCVFTILPLKTTTQAKEQMRLEFNNHVRNYTDSNYIVDVAKIFPNPNDLTLWNADGIHLNATGYEQLAREVNFVLASKSAVSNRSNIGIIDNYGQNWHLKQNGVKVIEAVEAGSVEGTLYLNSGRIGVGTSLPASNSTLYVYGASNPQISIANTTNAGVTARVNLGLSAGTDNIAIGTVLNDAVLTGKAGNDICFATSPSSSGITRLKIKADGTLETRDVNIQTGTTTGTKLGTATTQKIGFWNATPIVQPSGVTVSSALVNSGLIASPVAATVAEGGTGVATLTGLVKGNGTSAFSAAVEGTDYAPASGFTTSEVTGTSANLAVNTRVIANNAGLVTLTLPATAALGTVIEIVGKGAGGWLIAQNASQVINASSGSTTPGVTGSIASQNRYDCTRLVCTTANTDWVIQGGNGTLTFV